MSDSLSLSVPAGEPLQGFARRRMSGDERRQQLIEAALHLFATNGFRGTTTKAIAQAAGVSEGIIFRYFPTKEDLYTAILNHKARQQGIDRTLETLRRTMAEQDDEALVTQLALNTFKAFRRDADFQRLMLRAALESEDLAQVAQRTLGLPLFAPLHEYVEKRQAAGALRAGDPGLLVFAMVALPTYFSIVSRLFGLEFVKLSDRDAATTFARLMLDGLRQPGQPGSTTGANGTSSRRKKR